METKNSIRKEILSVRDGLSDKERASYSQNIADTVMKMHTVQYADNILVMKQGEVYMQGNVEEIFMQAEKLFDANLDVPQITKLFIELKKRNLCRSNDVYTVGYAKKEIEKLIKDSENA